MVSKAKILGFFTSHLGLRISKFSSKSVMSIEHMIRILVVPMVQWLLGQMRINLSSDIFHLHYKSDFFL